MLQYHKARGGGLDALRRLARSDNSLTRSSATISLETEATDEEEDVILVYEIRYADNNWPRERRKLTLSQRFTMVHVI